ncbi:MAG TPA: PEGA domain-containing protein [Candidatus Nanopelagicales bacterium]|nr:PEGA domain-containing protein [Candidatus Nanopelagicales bacterium]
MTSTSAAVLSGLLALATSGTALAQGAGAKPAAPAAPAAPAQPAAAQPAGGAAKPAAAPEKPKKPLTEQQKKTAAKKAYKEAEAAFEKGDFAAALPLYREADEMVPGAPPKYKIAQSVDKLGNVVDAVAAYQAYLDAKPDPEKFKDQVATATTRIDELKKTPAKVKVAIVPETAAPQVKILVDDIPQTGTELALTPGKHTIKVQAPGFQEAAQEVEVTFAEARDVSVTLTELPPPPPPPVEPPPPEPVAPAPPPPPPPEPRSPIPAYVTLGLAGAGAVVGTIFGVMALSAKSDFDSDPTIDNADAVDRNALIADMSYAVAITFGVTGAVLLLSGNDEPAPPAATGLAKPKPRTAKTKGYIAPYVGPTGGGAAARFTF